MHYRQDAKLNSKQKKHAESSGVKVQQIVFDKQITQQWKLDTNEPTELLPFCLKKVYLSRICDFWHQVKFLYFQNYEQSIQSNTNRNGVKLEVDHEQQYSSVQSVHNLQRLQQCKIFSRKIWKITRQRLLKALNSIKQEAGIEDEQSLELQDEKLNSYMRFLKLQQNKRIDIAIETFDSVVQKNTRRKLLNAFLNMRERLKNAKKKQTYTDRIKIECFIEIVLRNIRKLNSEVMSECFFQVLQLSERIKRQRQYDEQEITKKQAELIAIQRSKQFNRTLNNKDEHFKSVSNKKVVINDDLQSQVVQNHQTINKYTRSGATDSKKLRNNQNHVSTVKRDGQTSKQILHNSKMNSMTSEYHSNVKSSNQRIIHSHYYYEQEEQLDDNQDQFNESQGQVTYNRRTNNMNSLPTRRGRHTMRNQSNHYTINGIENNINSETLQKKTARTPSRSDVNRNSFQYQHLDFQTNQLNRVSQSNQLHTDPHFPITQRIQKHYHQQHNQQYEQQQMSQHQSESKDNVQQQICVIRNFSSTPARKPDRYEKIPILSSNIEFRQFFLNAKQKKYPKNIQIHSNSYYENICCQGCHYCLRLKQVKQLVEQIPIKKLHLHTSNYTLENLNLKNQIITQTLVRQQANSEHLATDSFEKIQKINKPTKQQFQSSQLNVDKINEKDPIITVPKIKYITNHLQKQHQGFTNKKIERKSHLADSPQQRASNNTYRAASPVVSAFTQGGGKSKTLSQRRVFSRKPMY